MRRRTVMAILAGAGAVATWPLALAAQESGRVYRVGYLALRRPKGYAARYRAMRLALHELGYIEGHNIVSVYKNANGNSNRLPELAEELVRLKADVIVVVGGNLGIRAAMNATRTIPIVMTGPGSDPVKAGFISSLARPGGNVTGITILTRNLDGKRLALLKEIRPSLARVAVLYDPTIPGATREVKEDLPIAARALGMTTWPWEVRRTDDFGGIFAALNKEPPDGLYVPGGGAAINSSEKRIVAFALKSRLPGIFGHRRVVAAGGLMAYEADLADSYRRVATYVDRIFRGARPRDLPVEQPTRFKLTVNLKTAKALGITIPPSILLRADGVIE